MAFRTPLRSLSSRRSISVRSLQLHKPYSASSRPPPFPTVPTCPSPTCECAATPAMPEGLPIDHKGKLNGLISTYAEQVLICTGRDDWPSRIEEDNEGQNLAADLKALLGRGGRYTDPFHNISVLNASFPPSTLTGLSERPTTTTTTKDSSSVYLLPSFKYIPVIPRGVEAGADALVRGYLQPTKPHAMHDGLPSNDRARLTLDPSRRADLPSAARDVGDVLVLVCGHGGRDMRCGVMGPALRDEFEAQLPREGVRVLRGEVDGDGDELCSSSSGTAARVGLISHMGGHKFAGNVIIYLPPTIALPDGGKHPLAGHGIWYGRVEPRHVQGVIRETILRGNVIADMFRGGITPTSEILRL